MSVRRLLGEMDSVELSEWIAFDRVESSESWVQNAQLCAVMANVMGSGKKKYSAEDFLPARPLREAPDLADKLAQFAQMFREPGPPAPPQNSFGRLHGD